MALKHAKPGETVDLRPLEEGLATAKTSAIVRTPSFEAVHLIVLAGSEIASHKVSGPITLYCIEGHAKLGLHNGPVDLKAGDWVYLEGDEPHSVRGIEDASLLLTIFFKSDLNPQEQ